MTEPMFSKASQNCAKLPPKQRLVCRFLMENSTRIPFLTVEELAAASGASPATVVRVVNGLGYEKYQDLKGNRCSKLMSRRGGTPEGGEPSSSMPGRNRTGRKCCCGSHT